MKKVLISLFLAIASISFTQNLEAIKNFEMIYPSVTQTLEDKLVFGGDRHGEFEGDLVAFLSDGSAWKIHPTQRQQFRTWENGDQVRIKVRTDHYWFKREHKFSLYNETRGEALKVMIVRHIDTPIQLKIVSTDLYVKEYTTTPVSSYQWVFENGQMREREVVQFITIPVYRKVLVLSDGSSWVIKDNIDEFRINSYVYVGAQGNPKNWYDFIMITGTEREAIWSFGRPQN